MGERPLYPGPDIRFDYIVPQTDETARRHEWVSQAFRAFAREMDSSLPGGMHEAVAVFDLLEDAAQKAHVAVARYGLNRPLQE